MYTKELYRKVKSASIIVTASTAADEVNSTTITNIGSLYRIACSTLGTEIFINPTTVTLTTNKNGVLISAGESFSFIAGSSVLQTLSTDGTGLFQLTEMDA